MAVKFPLQQLKEFDTLAILPINTYAPETYLVPIRTFGNSILSSVYVRSMDVGSSVLCRYFDTTTGETINERYDLDTHPIITPSDLIPIYGYTHRLTVTKIHDKPMLEVVVTGGNVQFGIYASLVSSFATDMDSALKLEDQSVNFIRDKGIPIAVLDEASQEWNFLRSTNGRLQVDVPGVLQTSQLAINHKIYGIQSVSVYNNQYTLIDFTIAIGMRFFWLSGLCTSDSWADFEVYIDGELYIKQRTSYDSRNEKLSLDNPLILTAGQQIIVIGINKSITQTDCALEVWLFGALETI